MSSTIHDPKAQMAASFHSEGGDGGFVMSAVGLQTAALMDDFEDEEDSPYEEVRASVSNMDDPEMPVLTFRMWIIGIFLTVGSAAANTFFNFRNPQIYIVSLPVLLVAYPLGRFAAAVLPIRNFQLPKLLGGGQFSFNPGPFNIKEHVCIYMMANVAIYPAYALNLIVVNEYFYKTRFGIGFNYCIALSTHLTGFGLAGICKRMLVRPASLIWPQTLVTSTLLNTLHAEEDLMGSSGGGITRYRWFLYVALGAFLWQWLPGYLFTGLSTFSWVCLIAPKNKVVNQLFGTMMGLGMSSLSFDWNQISWIGSPLMVPWWAEVHIFIGFVLFWWIILPILYYNDVWHLSHLPMGDTDNYDRFGNTYNISSILTPEKRLNVTAYENYSDIYITPPYLMFVLMTFMLSTCIITHTALYHGRTLWNAMRSIDPEDEDIHAKLMKAYPEVPKMWYWGILVFFFIVGVIAVERWPTGVPVYSLLIAIALPVIYILPGGLIFAVTGQILTLNLLGQIMPGALMPGNPLGNMIFKTYSVETINVSLLFVQDLKQGHYLKIPPRASFLVQCISTVLCVTCQIAVKEWIFSTVPDICERGQPDHLTCPRNRVFYSASTIWGLVGPTRQFGPTGIYHYFLYAMLLGALAPIPFWLWQRKFPNTRLKFINLPVLLNGPTLAPPANGINYTSWFIVGFIFQRLIRKRNFRWWSKFNYITTAAMDSGTLISVLLIFLSLQINGQSQLNWWGNRWFAHTLDEIAMEEPFALRATPPEGFAPSPRERLGH